MQQLANTRQVRAVLETEFAMKGRMSGNSWTDKSRKDPNLRLVSVLVGYEEDPLQQEAVRLRAEGALRAAGFGNTVKVTHVPAVLQARQYGGTYVRVPAPKA